MAQLEGRSLSTPHANGDMQKDDPQPSERQDMELSSRHSALPMSTGDQFQTAVTHKQLYPRLESTPLSTDSEGACHSYSMAAGGRSYVEDGRSYVEDGREESPISEEGDASTDMSDFATAQQTNSKLLQLLTSEYASRGSDEESATPSVGGVLSSSLHDSPNVPTMENRGIAYEELERPRSVVFKSPHPHTKKSPLATNVSKAPQLLLDHAQLKTEEEPRLHLLTTDPHPSAPPIDALQPEIKKVNSYSGLGKKRSLFASPVALPPSKKPNHLTERPTVGVAGSVGVRVPSSGWSRSSFPSGALNLASKVLTQATSRVGLSSLADKQSPSHSISPLSHEASPGGISSSPYRPVAAAAGGPALRQAMPSSHGQVSSPPAPRQATPSSPSRAVSSSSSSAGERARSTPNRAVSWLEHLKSKLPIHQ